MALTENQSVPALVPWAGSECAEQPILAPLVHETFFIGPISKAGNFGRYGTSLKKEVVWKLVPFGSHSGDDSFINNLPYN